MESAQYSKLFSYLWNIADIDEIRGDHSREEKLTKIGDILSYMRRKGLVVSLSSDHSPIWVLFKTDVAHLSASGIDAKPGGGGRARGGEMLYDQLHEHGRMA